VRFSETPIAGVVRVDLELLRDDRGHFARTFSAGDFAALGMDPHVSQCNTSYNDRAGTVRGLHFQAQPFGEAKLVRCTRGAIFDVAVDLRPSSASFRRWFGAELSADDGRMLFIPIDVAHGFQTLEDSSEVLYQMSHEYVPGAARGVRWDDPAFAIEWPAPPQGGRVISERDATYPDFAG
jgi:dTDP-4-dehydrorhamnose 3,5-epimerase